MGLIKVFYSTLYWIEVTLNSWSSPPVLLLINKISLEVLFFSVFIYVINFPTIPKKTKGCQGAGNWEVELTLAAIVPLIRSRHQRRAITLLAKQWSICQNQPNLTLISLDLRGWYAILITVKREKLACEGLAVSRNLWYSVTWHDLEWSAGWEWFAVSLAVCRRCSLWHHQEDFWD